MRRSQVSLFIFFLICQVAIVMAQDSLGRLQFKMDTGLFQSGVQDLLEQDFLFEIPFDQLTYTDDPKFPDRYVRVVVNTAFSIKNRETGDIVASDQWDTPAAFAKRELQLQPSYRLMFSELLSPGDYMLDITLTDIHSKRAGKKLVPFVVTDPPKDKLALSDIILATNIQPDSLKSIFNKNGYAMQINPDNVFTIQEPFLWFYYEIYNLNLSSDEEKLIHVKYTIVSAEGDTIKSYHPGSFRRPEESCIIVDGKNIVTLKDGDYFLLVEVTDTGSEESVILEKKFSMVREWAQLEQEAELEPMSDDESHEFLDKVQYVISKSEKKQFQGLNPEAKARFAYRFWRERDPNPFTPENEFKIELERRVNYANTFFASKQAIRANKKGIKTDRGRIYLKYGEPSEQREDNMPQSDREFIVWNYFNLKNISVFVFSDKVGRKDPQLIFSDDPTEISDPTLRKTLGSDWEYMMESLNR
ncbi:MAG: hypothetical protein B6244_11405 [Candidatus Cloacimonetes bacterium 4572_55]|nr:MAG: hypothetical protein B6244_11405 [Candidatus Cloacimonetes bacterium 4572_55]